MILQYSGACPIPVIFGWKVPYGRFPAYGIQAIPESSYSVSLYFAVSSFRICGYMSLIAGKQVSFRMDRKSM